MYTFWDAMSMLGYGMNSKEVAVTVWDVKGGMIDERLPQLVTLNYFSSCF